jgi:hypothetical protein
MKKNKIIINKDIEELKIPERLLNIITSNLNDSNKKHEKLNKNILSEEDNLKKTYSIHSLSEKIENLNKKFSSLLLNYKEKSKILMEFQIRNEDKKNKNKIENIKNEYSFIYGKLLNEIEFLKQKLEKFRKKHIKLEKHLEIINKENLQFKNRKLILLNKLIEYKTMINSFQELSNRSKINEFINNNGESSLSLNSILSKEVEHSHNNIMNISSIKSNVENDIDSQAKKYKQTKNF